jgi:hypothetical protein
MDEEFDTVIHPQSPLLPLPNMRYENHFELDPSRIEPIINIVVRLDPITVHIARIGLLCADASVDEYVINASYPKRRHRGSQSFFRSHRRRGVNPNRLPISSKAARWSPGGSTPVAGSKAGITPPPRCQGQYHMSTVMLHCKRPSLCAKAKGPSNLPSVVVRGRTMHPQRVYMSTRYSFAHRIGV